MSTASKLRVAFVHPDLGIALGHCVDIYTSHHDEKHCFDETRDGTLRVHHVVPPFPRSWRGKFHILFAHARQLHLTKFLLSSCMDKHDVFFVDQLSTCIPLLRLLGGKRVVFYCHFPDKLLANGAFVEGRVQKRSGGILKRIYRYPMDWLEEVTTRQADIILANSRFTARVTMAYFTSLKTTPKVTSADMTDPDIVQVTSSRPTLLSLNRFEMKKNAALAVEAVYDWSLLVRILGSPIVPHNSLSHGTGGYDPRLEDNIRTLNNLVDLARTHNLTFKLTAPSKSSACVPSFPGMQLHTLNQTSSSSSISRRDSDRQLLQAPSTVTLLYTPANEHFGIGPVEGMLCWTACSGMRQRVWADTLEDICQLSEAERAALTRRCRDRARAMFGMEAMAKAIDVSLHEAIHMGGSDLCFAFVVGLMVAILCRV
ncbi:glycosyltransferase family 4 protein [Pisolithus sp. B1]|nr:glycosyltransferase family 4 protein [Pisolithus sp. B1]